MLDARPKQDGPYSLAGLALYQPVLCACTGQCTVMAPCTVESLLTATSGKAHVLAWTGLEDLGDHQCHASSGSLW